MHLEILGLEAGLPERRGATPCLQGAGRGLRSGATVSLLRRVLAAVVQSLGLVRLFVASWTAACQASLSSTVSWSLLRLMSLESVMLSEHELSCRDALAVDQSQPWGPLVNP